MKTAILHGSPKGEQSVTLQYVRYLQKRHPGREYDVIHVGRDIAKIEKDRELFTSLLARVKEADAVLWSTPVYYLCVPSQLMRFVELVTERGELEAFACKYATAVTTSVHFFDHTAHQYLQAVSEDLGMRYVRGYSAHMEDLMKKEERESLFRFGELFFRTVDEKLPVAGEYPALGAPVPPYEPGEVEDAPKTLKKKVLVLTDATPDDGNLRAMVETFVRHLPCEAEVVNLHDLAMRGGCLSCYQCAWDNTCVYTDDVPRLFREKIAPADALIEAGTVRGRFFSTRWKMFMDRSFFNGHVPIFTGKVIGFIVSGALRQAPMLRTVLDGESEAGGAYSLGIVTDESGDAAQITGLLKAFARQAAWALEKNVKRPPMFYGAASKILFRDMIYAMRFFFRADHRYYASHGLYDFPQKDIGRRVLNTCMMALTSIPSVRRSFYRSAKEKMLEQYEKVLGE